MMKEIIVKNKPVCSSSGLRCLQCQRASFVTVNPNSSKWLYYILFGKFLLSNDNRKRDKDVGSGSLGKEENQERKK